MGKRNKSNVVDTPAVDESQKRQERVDALVALLRVAADNKQRNEGKKIRRALRALGHRGGLRAIDAALVAAE